MLWAITNNTILALQNHDSNVSAKLWMLSILAQDVRYVSPQQIVVPAMHSLVLLQKMWKKWADSQFNTCHRWLICIYVCHCVAGISCLQSQSSNLLQLLLCWYERCQTNELKKKIMHRRNSGEGCIKPKEHKTIFFMINLSFQIEMLISAVHCQIPFYLCTRGTLWKWKSMCEIVN